MDDEKGDDSGIEMEEIDDDDLREQVKAQLQSETPIIRKWGGIVLHRAVAKGLEKVVARLLAACPRLIDEHWGDETALFLAAEGGHTGIVAQLLAVNPDLADIRTDEGTTALHRAIEYGHTTIVAQLLAASPASIDAVTEKGQTALHCAVRGGNKEIVAQLLAAKPTLIEAKDNDGQTALHDAISWNRDEIAEQLLAAHPPLIEAIISGGDSWTALLNVIKIGHAEAVARVLALHPDLIQKPSSKCGWTVFHHAAHYGREIVMSRLLAAAVASQLDLEQVLLLKSTEQESGANEGSTALHVAALKGFSNIVAQLLAACPALVDVLGDDGQTCLHSPARGPTMTLVPAVQAQGNENEDDDEDLPQQIEEQLLSASPIFFGKSNIFGETRQTALHRAAEKGLGEAVARLLAACPFLIDEQCDMTGTALHCAARSGHAGIVTQLLAASPNSIEARTKEDWTALHCAAYEGHTAIVPQLLAANPAAIDVRLDDGRTVLHCAITRGHEEIVALLLAAKPASIEAKANNATVLQWAANHAGITTQLLAAHPPLLEATISDMGSWPVLINLIDLGLEEAVARVLALHPDLIQKTSSDGWTVFHHAAHYGRDKVMSTLLAAVASQLDLERVLLLRSTKQEFLSGNKGLTALHVAAREGFSNIVAQLLAACPALVDVLDDEGQTCLHSAARGYGSWESTMESWEATMDTLLDFKPALAHAVDAQGDTILHTMLRKLHGRVVERVWKLNPHALRAVNRAGETPFHIALAARCTRTVDLLQWGLTFEEIESAYNKCEQSYVAKLKPWMERQCEELVADYLLPGVVALVFEYLGLCDGGRTKPSNKQTTRSL